MAVSAACAGLRKRAERCGGAFLLIDGWAGAGVLARLSGGVELAFAVEIALRRISCIGPTVCTHDCALALTPHARGLRLAGHLGAEGRAFGTAAQPHRVPNALRIGIAR